MTYWILFFLACCHPLLFTTNHDDISVVKSRRSPYIGHPIQTTKSLPPYFIFVSWATIQLLRNVVIVVGQKVYFRAMTNEVGLLRSPIIYSSHYSPLRTKNKPRIPLQFTDDERTQTLFMKCPFYLMRLGLYLRSGHWSFEQKEAYRSECRHFNHPDMPKVSILQRIGYWSTIGP